MIAKIRRFLTVRRAQSETPLQREQRKNIALHFELAAANKRAEEAQTMVEYWRDCYIVAARERDAIKRAKSAAVAKGNRTRKAKREAAALVARTGCQQSIVQ